MKSQNLHAIIIGGGIAGPALALLLKKAGMSSTVYEAHPCLEDLGGGFTIAPNGMNVLEEIGVADSVADGGTKVSEFCFRNQSGKILACYRAGHVEKYRWPSVATARTALHRILMEETARQGIQVEYHKRLKELTTVDGGRILALLEDGTTARGDFLVGADGVHSRVRQIIFPSAPSPSYLGVLGVGGFVAPSAVVAADAADRERLNFTVGCSGQFGYCSTRQNEDSWMWWCHLPQDRELTSLELAAVPNEELRTKLLERYIGWHEPIGTFLVNTPAIIKTNIYEAPRLPAWHKDRVVLVGDAAHAMSPSAGQGASVALEDALHLVKLLRQFSGEFETVFGEFERARRQRAERISAQAHKNETRQRIELGPLGCWLRDSMLSVVLPLFGARSLDWMYSYHVDYNQSIRGQNDQSTNYAPAAEHRHR
jgi:2-polyprenyl-6-methoxyphenol hydroxylase-like FAD-dependent oxidoreductase